MVDFDLDGLLARGLDDTRAPPMFSSPHRPDVPRSSSELLVFPIPSSSVPSSFDLLPPFRLMPPSPCLGQSLPLGATSDDGSTISPASLVLPPRFAPDDFDFDPYLRSGEMPTAGGPPWQPRRARAMSDDSHRFNSISFPLFDEPTLPDLELGLESSPAMPPRLRSSSAPVPSTLLWPDAPPKLGRSPRSVATPSIAEEPWVDDTLTESSFSSSYGHSRAASVMSDATSVAEGPPMRLITGVDGRKAWQCLEPGCDKTFQRPSHLERHAVSLHAKARRASFAIDAADSVAFVCEVADCGKTFSRDDNRRCVMPAWAC